MAANDGNSQSLIGHGCRGPGVPGPQGHFRTGSDGRFPFWSFDSRYIVFWTGGKLKKIDASSGPPQTLCDAPVPVFRGFWTRDNRIVFASATGVLQVATGGGVPSPLTTLDRARQEIYHGVPALLPDGRHFAFLRYAPGSVENGGIYLASLDTKPEAQGLKPWATYHKRQLFDECGTPC